MYTEALFAAIFAGLAAAGVETFTGPTTAQGDASALKACVQGLQANRNSPCLRDNCHS